MKKLSLLIAFGALLLTACQKEQLDSCALNGERVPVSFTAALSDGAATKASLDGDGKGTWADQCKLQVWWQGKLFLEKTVDVVDFKADFENLMLIKGQTYDFLFWADNAAGDYYVTDTLTKVSLKGDYLGCDDKRDAFSAAIADTTVSAAFSKSVLLYRPFAQLNVITTDIPVLKAQFGDNQELFDAAVPDSVSVSVTVPTVFNVKTGQTSAPKTLTYATDVYTKPYKTASDDKNTLSMDYFFAPVEESKVEEVGFRLQNHTSGLADIDCTFSNIPLRRNYRTNILGALITLQGTISVEIKPEWNGETDVDANGNIIATR